MSVYIKWDCHDLGNGAEGLRDALSRLSPMPEELRGVHRRLDPQLAGYEGIGRTFGSLLEGVEEAIRRIRNECSALDGVLAVYADAERATLRASESLPASITERNLVFEGWFNDLLR